VVTTAAGKTRKEAHAFYAFHPHKQAKMCTKVASTDQNSACDYVLQRGILSIVGVSTGFPVAINSLSTVAFLPGLTSLRQGYGGPPKRFAKAEDPAYIAPPTVGAASLDALWTPHYACEVVVLIASMSYIVNGTPSLIRRVLRLAGGLATGVLLVCAVDAAAQSWIEPTVYRIFLKTGTPLVSWGEFARVGDRVAFTLALGDPTRPDSLQMVSLPSSVVDWDRTNQYADAVRYHRYAQTRGESDYKVLTDEMAHALMSIAFARDPAARLAAAEEARRRLVEWPAQHFGYRAADVRDLASAVEETIAGIRADAGDRHFSIDLVATIEPPSTPLMDAPTVRESIELAAEVAKVTDVPANRMSLQEAILATLGRNPSYASADWALATRRGLVGAARAAERIDHQYADLVSRATKDAGKRAVRGDVSGVDSILAKVRQKDEQLGRQRPMSFRTLVTVLEAQLESARQRRLDLDRWRYRDQTYRAYRKGIDNSLTHLADVTRAIEAIRAMSGPKLRDLKSAERDLLEARAAVMLAKPPDELQASHDALVSGVQLMQAAVSARRTAMTSASLEAARNASAAAAGAILLVERARGEINAFFAPPTLK